MKKILVIFLLLIIGCSAVFADDGIYLSPGVAVWASPLTITHTDVAAADYPIVSDATVNTESSSIIPLTMVAELEAGYRLDALTIFAKFGICAPEGPSLKTNASSSTSYYSSSSGTSTYRAYDKFAGSIWEMNLTANVSYDLLLTEEEVGGFSLYAFAGGGVNWLFNNGFGFYEVGSWPSSYSGSGSPSPSYIQTVSFDMVLPQLVPLAEAGAGVRHYFDEMNSVSVGVMVSYYFQPRLPDNAFRVQDGDGNAMEVSFSSEAFVPRLYIGYGLSL